MSRARLSKAIAAACAVPLTLSTISAPAFAEEEIEEVVVTGSYIRRNTADSPSPLTVIDRAQIEQTGAIEIADIVNRMTFNSGSTNNTNAFSGGDNSTGQTNINLRNLGLGSTLVLINGRRYVPTSSDSGGNQFVNTSTLVPSIALERVEVVKDGASALYGSDAVAGVVNFITRDGFEGMELSFDYRTDQETREQDDYTFAGIWGISNDRGHMTASFEFLERKPLQIDDRYDRYGNGSGVSTLGNPGTFVPFAADGVDAATAGAIVPAYITGGVVGGSPGLGDLDCGIADGLHRQSFPTPLSGSPLASNGLESFGCLYDFSPFFNLVGQETRAIAHLSGEYDLSPSTQVYGEFSFADQEFSRENSLFPLVRFPTIPIDNPGLQNDLARRSALAAAADPALGTVLDPANGLVGGATFFGRVLGFTPSDTGGPLRPVDTDTREFSNTYRGVLGLRGELPFGEDWEYDASFTRSERNNDARNTDTIQNHLNLALNGLGGPLCDPASGTAGSGNAGTGQCFYYNPFFSAFFAPDGSRQTDPNLITPPDVIQWMVGEIKSTTDSEQMVFDFVANGDLFEMPSGLMAGMAFGVQWRRDEIRFDADSISNNGGYSFIFGAQDFEGKENVYAAFLELALPVTETFDLQLAARYEEFDELGDNTFDPKLTALWRATDDLTLRASTGTSFRVGSLIQRFGSTTQLINIADPFSGAGLAFRPEISQGRPDLDPETAFVWNVGLSWAPSDGALEGLSVDLDYYDYDYEDLITRPGGADLVAADIASRCPQGLNDDPTDSIPDCGIQDDGSIISIGPGVDGVIRDDNLNFLRTEPNFTNAQELQASGLDFTVRYEWPTDDFGFWTAQVTGSWANEYEVTDSNGVTTDGVGKRNANTVIGRTLPEFKVNYSLGWQLGRHSAFAMVRYIDEYEDDQPLTAGGQCVGSCLRATLIGQPLLQRDVDDFTTLDLQYSYELPSWGWQAEGSRITIGGNNVTNEDPPMINFDGAYDPFVHDPRGAVWYARYTMNL
jgi:outer membrane receptor protein involved in Fe transport